MDQLVLFIISLLATGIPGVIIGASLILKIPDRAAEIALGCLTLGLGIYSTMHKNLGQSYQLLHRDTRGYLVGGTVLFVIGILNGSLTSGTGLFVTLGLVR